MPSKPSEKGATNNHSIPETDKRLQEIFDDIENILVSFGGIVLLRQSSSFKPIFSSELREEAKQFIERNRDTIYILFRT